MRVISGSARGLKLVSPRGLDTRPTLDRVKEAVFSILLPHIADASVLDLFAGSGAMGIESISRGASDATFVDNARAAIACITANVNAAKMTDCSEIVCADAETFLSKCRKKYNIIYLDPPFSKGMYSSVLKSICDNKVLTDDGLIIVEWDKEVGFTENLYEFNVLKEKKYGRVGITVLKWGVSQ